MGSFFLALFLDNQIRIAMFYIVFLKGVGPRKYDSELLVGYSCEFLYHLLLALIVG